MRFYVAEPLYGRGRYFGITARDAHYYTELYTNPENSAVTQLLCGEVVTGISMVGYPDLKYLPPDWHSASSAVMHPSNVPSVFAVFKDAAARPAYVITVEKDVKLMAPRNLSARLRNLGDESDHSDESEDSDSVESDDE